MADMSTIETAALCYNEELRLLKEKMEEKDGKIRELKTPYEAAAQKVEDEYWPQIKERANACIKALEVLKGYVEESPEQFIKPKTRTYEGVKVGFVKDKDSIAFKHAEERVIELITEKLPEQYRMLVQDKSSLVKDAFLRLSDDELKAIGAKRVKGEDAPVVSLKDSVVQKMLEEISKGGGK
jgi:hypothetical protein